MDAVIWVVETALPYLLGLFAVTAFWHLWDEAHREPTGTVRDWFDDAKARQYGQPYVRVDVLDHYDERNDCAYVG